MRLRYRGFLPDELDVQRRIHRHTYLTIEIGDLAKQAADVAPPHHHLVPLYWRLDDPEFSLVEIGVERYTGRLTSFALPLYNGTLSSIDDGENTVTETVRGVPTFDLTPWPSSEAEDSTIASDYHDVEGRVRLHLGENELRVVLYDEPQVRRLSIRDRVACDFNASSELCAISILDVTPSEEELLAEAISQRT